VAYLFSGMGVSWDLKCGSTWENIQTASIWHPGGPDGCRKQLKCVHNINAPIGQLVLSVGFKPCSCNGIGMFGVVYGDPLPCAHKCETVQCMSHGNKDTVLLWLVGTTGMVCNVRQCKYKAKKLPGGGNRFFSSLNVKTGSGHWYSPGCRGVGLWG
jgi:hypothetical protein